MPDQVDCTRDSSHHFTCQVHIGSDPEPEPATGGGATGALATPSPSPPPRPPPPAVPNPAVSALVQRHTQISLPAPEVPYITDKALVACAGRELSILVAALTEGPLAILAGFAAGFDTTKCLADERNIAGSAARQKAAAEDCVAHGGTVVGVIDDGAVCEKPAGRR